MERIECQRIECPNVPGGYWMWVDTGDCACGSNHYRWASVWNPNGLTVPAQHRAEVSA